MDGNVVNAARLNFAVQLISKLFTFTLNQLLISRIEPSSLGLISIQFELAYSSILILSREPFRSVLLRIQLIPSTPPVKILQMVTLALLSPLFGLFLFTLIANFHQLSYSDSNKFYFLIYCSAAIFELLAEPVFITCQNLHLYHVRAYAESIATFLKCTLTFLIITYFRDSKYTIFAFSIAQLIYGISVLFVYSISIKPSIIPLLPQLKQLSTANLRPCINRKDFKLALSFYAQTIVKLALSEGDRIVSSLASTPHDQGILALVSSYGSLIVRLLYLPLEDSIRSNLGKSSSHFTSLFRQATRLQFYLLLSGCTFAPFYAGFIVRIVAGDKWVDAGDVLIVYVLYVGILGLNGTSEAYLHSLSSQSQVLVNTIVMIFLFFIYAAVSYTLHLYNYGTVGIVIASVCNVFMRTCYACVQVSLITKTPIRDFIGFPPWKTSATFIGSFIVLYASRPHFQHQILYFIFGVVIFGLNLMAIVAMDETIRNLLPIPWLTKRQTGKKKKD